VFKNIKHYKENSFFQHILETQINTNARVTQVLNLKIDKSLQKIIGERDLPGEEKYKKNKWWEIMLLRYGIAMHYSKGKDVIETCSGLGWGAYLLDGVAKSVTCIEIDTQAIDVAKKLWKTEHTIYINNSVLKINTKDNKFDVAIAMESIEHFRMKDIEKYLGEIYRILKPGGFLIGSSSFPNTRKEANNLSEKNKFHLYICTKQEMVMLLKKQGFKKIKIFQNRIFFMARK